MNDSDLDSAIMDTEDEFTDFEDDEEDTVDSDDKLTAPAAPTHAIFDMIPVVVSLAVVCIAATTFYRSPSRVVST